MIDDSKGNAAFERRAFLAASGGLIAALGAAPSFAQSSQHGPAMEQWHKAPSIPLWPSEAPNGGYIGQVLPEGFPPFFVQNVEKPFLRVFQPEKPNGRSILVIPGGAYKFISIANEGIDLANALSARGFTVFVLVYRLPGEGWTRREDVPLQDAQRAMRLIRASAGQYSCDPEQIYVIGFSAGGHLAATLETSFGEHVYSPLDAADRLTARPRGAGLIYPVISHSAGIGHAESTLLLLGKDPPMLNVVRRSPDLHVSEYTPPTFLLHAMDDPAVPLENSLIMMGALRAARRPVEAHFFEKGGHGFGLGTPGQPVSRWLELFINWMHSHA